MNSKNELQNIIHHFRTIMDSHQKHLINFCDQGVQLEGWLQGEFLCFLDDQKEIRRIVNFDREVKFSSSKGRVDFCLEIPGEMSSSYIWIELKHWLIGFQKGYKLNPMFYFTDRTSVGIKPDVDKLMQIKEGDRYLLILCTANPGEEEWLKGVTKFNQKFTPRQVEPLTDPTEFPSIYFLGLLHVHGYSS
jgi:hypothetical protein